MIVNSYLVNTALEKQESVRQLIQKIEGAEVFPADNSGLLILVLEYSSIEEQKEKLKRIEAIQGIECLTMVFGNVEPTREGSYAN